MPAQGTVGSEAVPMMMRHENENLPIMAQTVAMGLRPEDISKVTYASDFQPTVFAYSS